MLEKQMLKGLLFKSYLSVITSEFLSALLHSVWVLIKVISKVLSIMTCQGVLKAMSRKLEELEEMEN